MPKDLKTDADLLRRLHDAVRHQMTRDELRAQKVSFILGAMPKDSTVTKGQVEEILNKSEGVPA